MDCKAFIWELRATSSSCSTQTEERKEKHLKKPRLRPAWFISVFVLATFLVIPTGCGRIKSQLASAPLVQISGTITDRLNRPLPDVKIHVYRDGQDRASHQAVTAQDGTFRVVLSGKAQYNFILKKEFYLTERYPLNPQAGTEVTITLTRIIEVDDIQRLETLDGEALVSALIDVLAGIPVNDTAVAHALFSCGDKINPSLFKLRENPVVGAQAVRYLCRAGDPGYIPELAKLIQESKRSNAVDEMFLIGALVGSTPKDEWAWDVFSWALDRSWRTHFAAVEALTVNGTDKARDLLGSYEFRRQGKGKSSLVSTSRELTSGFRGVPTAPTFESILKECVHRIPDVRKTPEFETLQTTIRPDGNKALVHVRFGVAAHTPTYAFCFLKSGGLWRPAGVWRIAES